MAASAATAVPTAIRFSIAVSCYSGPARLDVHPYLILPNSSPLSITSARVGPYPEISTHTSSSMRTVIVETT